MTNAELVKTIEFPVVDPGAFPKSKVFADLTKFDFDKEEDRRDWLMLRKNGIGGSDISAVFGVNKFMSLAALYFEKTSEMPSQEESERMMIGREIEPVIGRLFMKRTGKQLAVAPYMFQHPDHPWWTANIDFYVMDENAGVDCKNIDFNMRSDWEDEDGEEIIPDMYYLQCQHYMGALGLDVWYLAVLLGGNRFITRKVERNEDIIQAIAEKGADFWNNFVVPRVPPGWDGSDSAKKLLAMLYPSETEGTEIELPDTVDIMWDEREHLKQQIKELTMKADAIDNKIKALIGDNEYGLTERRVFTFRTTHRKGYEVKPTSYRVLRSRTIKKTSKPPLVEQPIEEILAELNEKG